MTFSLKVRRGTIKTLRYIFLTLLMVSMAFGLSGCFLFNSSPTASFNPIPSSGDAPLDVLLDASSSQDSDGEIVDYQWDFGDGNTGSGSAPTHVFQSTGTYTVDLTVADNDGATDSTSETITVTDDGSSAGNSSPDASFTASPTSGEAPLNVAFDASDSTDSDGSITSYSWDFGDGYSDSGVAPDHTYSSSGTYSAELTVIDDDNASDSTTTTIDVWSSNSSSGSADITALDSMWYETNLDYQVVGEVKNVGDGSAEYVKCVVTWYSDSGEMLGTDYSYTYLDVIAAGERSPFKVMSSDNDMNVGEVRLQLQWDDTSVDPGREVVVTQRRGEYDSGLGYYNVTGEVENQSANTVEYVMIIGTFYDSSGNVVNSGFTYSDLDTISPGNTAPFTLSVSENASKVEDYRLIVQHDVA